LIPQKTVGGIRNGSGQFLCSGLLDDGDCNSDTCAFRASIWEIMLRCISLLCLKGSINRCSRRSTASKLSSSCLWYWGIFLLAVLGVDSPHQRLLLIRLIVPECFIRTGYLPVLADFVLALTALFQVNLLTLERSHSGVGDFLPN